MSDTLISRYYEAIKNICDLKDCIHDDSSIKESLLETYEPIFERFSFSFILCQESIIGRDETHIIVKDIVETTNLSNSSFNDNTTTNIHTLKMSNDGKWRILNTACVELKTD